MQHQEQVRTMKLLLERLIQTRMLIPVMRCETQSVLTPARIGQSGWDQMFQSFPQVMGLSGDLPEQGSFLTSYDLGKPILMTRDRDGQFRAFLNVCSHRGTIVETEPRGRRNTFSCPSRVDL